MPVKHSPPGFGSSILSLSTVKPPTNSKHQGDLGVSSAISYYTDSGYIISFPLTDRARYDLVVDKEDVLYRVECKHSMSYSHSGKPIVYLETCGGNQSWSGTRKRISTAECDLLFVRCVNGSLYEFPSSIAEGKASLTLCEKYEEYKL